MTGHKVRLRLDGAGRGEVTVDGVRMACTSVQIDAPAQDKPKVTLTLLCAELDVEATAQVLLTGELRPSRRAAPPAPEPSAPRVVKEGVETR